MRGRITLLFFISCFLFCPLLLSAQQLQISGKVTAKSDGSPLPGVSVIVQGTKAGTSTDASGEFKINVPKVGSVLVFSLIGMKTYNYTVNDSKSVNITLEDESSILNEVVVVGYGTQKKSVVTGAISSVKAADLESQPITTVHQALQGRTSGVTIAANSGQPGSMATIRVRGFTTFGNNDPLYVVDGVVVDAGGMNFLNQSDIESIEVLKDAASQAIYGARAAAGVILITTKKGKSGKIQVNYTGFYGTSAKARKLDLLNATEYATLMNESAAAAGNAIPFADPRSFGKGTDWQDAIFNDDARRQNHELNISGANERSSFYTSFGYVNQEGIVASPISNYNRINIRLNSTHKIATWLTVGQNLGYSHEKSQAIGQTNTEFGGPLSSAINLDPITPLIETDPTLAAAYDQRAVRDPYNYLYGISPRVGQELHNPLAWIETQKGRNNWGDNIVGNVFAEVEPIKGLRLRSTLGTKLAFYGNEGFTPIYYLNPISHTTQNNFNRATNQIFNWNIENTASYSKAFQKHDFTLLLGQGAYVDNNQRGQNTTLFGLPIDSWKDASLNYSIPEDDKRTGGYENPQHKVTSIFARLNYNYDEKYLLTGVIRRDGSSRFGSNNLYGYFPSFSLGWVPSRESFWPTNEAVNSLKIRGGYGIVGNDNIGDFTFLPLIGGGRNYAFGTDGSYLIGWSPNAPANPDLKWEQTAQTNIGFEAILFQDFSLNFDWYKKVTSGILQNPRIPGYVGAVSNPAANVADMENRGVEVELGYRKKLGDVHLSLNGNVSYLENEITYLGRGLKFLSDGQNFQSTSFPITRTQIGQAFNAFYGFKSQGVFQTPEDVANYKNSTGTVIQPNAKPGDFRWADLNDDGAITELDRTFIGNPTPDWTYGITVNLDYKGFDFSALGQGVIGNQIFQALRRRDAGMTNYQADALNRWTGPGSTNSYPRLVDGDPNGNYTKPSDFYLEDGDYFRIKTLQLGYTLPQTLVKKAGLQRVRVYAMSENLVTFTKYTGFDPEIGGGVLSIDRGIYPQARSFMLGINLGL